MKPINYAKTIPGMLTKTLSVVIAFAVSASLFTGADRVSAQVYVTKDGVPDPDGTAAKPYHVVKSGIMRTMQTGISDTVIIGEGNYHETFNDTASYIDKPGLLLTSSGGRVNIGDMSDVTDSVTLRIITYNTMLWGDVWFGDSWHDFERAPRIGLELNNIRADVDLVGLQEVWDEEDLFWDPVTGIAPISGYPYKNHGSLTYLSLISSGLGILSNYPLSNWDQGEYDDCLGQSCCDGVDCNAAKGWVEMTTEKDGFHIGIFNTHTQAGSDNAHFRALQIEVLARRIADFRVMHPDHAIFVMGDFNVNDKKAEYQDSLIALLATYADPRVKDADRNSPGFNFDDINEHATKNFTTNTLEMYMGGETVRRIDYIFYIPPLDGSVEIVPDDVSLNEFRREPPLCDCIGEFCWFCTTDLSDHYAVDGTFTLYRIN